MTAQIRSRSPQRRDDVVVDTPAASTATVHAAVEASRCAQRSWRAAPPAARAAALARAADAVAVRHDELTALVVREVGKPLAEAGAEVTRAVGILRYAAQQGFDPSGELLPADGALLFTQRRPRGVAGLITPWNFPVAIPIWKAAPALVTGNTVIIKPAPAATATALLLGEILARCLPPDVVAVLPGDADTGAAVAVSSDVVSFTGSMAVGRQVATNAAARGVPFQAEMGGCNATIVLPDADRQHASGTIALAAMAFAGQKCTATSRIIVAGPDAGFTDALVAAVEQLNVGDPADPGVEVGPLISPEAAARTIEAGSAAHRAGIATLTKGAAVPDGDSFIAPIVLEDPDGTSTVASEEVFGPICTVERTADLPAAIASANRGPYGLVAAVFTADLDAALDAAQQLDAGLVRVNEPTTGVEFHAPFGGAKESGQGPREQGKYGRDVYTSVHTITVRGPRKETR